MLVGIKMRNNIGILVLITILCVTACAKQAVTPVSVASQDQQAVKVESKVSEITKNSNDFALAFYKRLSFQDRKSNLFFSPFSIWTAFSMLYEGAEGQTLDEMIKVFSFIADADKRKNSMQKELAVFKTTSSAYGINMANSLWINKDFPVRQYYKHVLNTYYFADVENTVNSTLINKWVQKNTSGKIKELFDASVNNSQIVLVNTIYFKSRWLLEFDKSATNKDKFFLSHGNPVNVDMMSQKNKFAYYENDKLQVIKMKYKDGRPMSMIIVLPKTFDLAVAQEFLQKLPDLDSLLKYNEVVVTMPKFEVDYALSLKNIIAKLGLTASDYSRISDSPLMISQAVHKAYIKVDEKETEAAAATGIAMVTSALMPAPVIEFKADKPFLYLITDDADGKILFMGRMVNPLK